MIYLVVLRLKSRRNNQFDTELEKQGDDITELFPDCWLLASDKTARGIFESVRSVIDLKDRLLIVEVDLKNHSSRLMHSAWEWIERQQTQSVPKTPAGFVRADNVQD
jgi:hypothetical protein